MRESRSAMFPENPTVAFQKACRIFDAAVGEVDVHSAASFTVVLKSAGSLQNVNKISRSRRLPDLCVGVSVSVLSSFFDVSSFKSLTLSHTTTSASAFVFLPFLSRVRGGFAERLGSQRRFRRPPLFFSKKVLLVRAVY